MLTFEFNLVCEEVNAFERPDYFTNRNDINFLYEFFKSKGYLYNTNELRYLQQAMSLYEKYKCLKIASINANLLEIRQKKQIYEAVCQKINDTNINIFAVNQVITKLDEFIHLVASPTRIIDFTKIITCHNWKDVKGE